jgi:hypothetical protein
VKPNRFLLDRDVSKAASLFQARRTRTVSDVGLAENAKDASISRKGTGTGGNYRHRQWRWFSPRGSEVPVCSTKRKDCHGLVILPNKYEIQKRTLGELGSRLSLRNSRISWDEVWWQNLCVR